jgi:hypothetical protein
MDKSLVISETFHGLALMTFINVNQDHLGPIREFLLLPLISYLNMAIPPVTTESEHLSTTSQVRPSPEAYDDTVIPPPYDGRRRTIVLCFDGTGDQFDLDVRS